MNTYLESNLDTWGRQCLESRFCKRETELERRSWWQIWKSNFNGIFKQHMLESDLGTYNCGTVWNYTRESKPASKVRKRHYKQNWIAILPILGRQIRNANLNSNTAATTPSKRNTKRCGSGARRSKQTPPNFIARPTQKPQKSSKQSKNHSETCVWRRECEGRRKHTVFIKKRTQFCKASKQQKG